jgi:hypothetical protein
MKFILASLFALAASLASAHEYFFAFAEVQYDEQSRKLEITLEGSAHDVEDALNGSGIPIRELEDHYKDAEMLAKLESFINGGLSFGTGAKLHLLGYEVLPTGMVYFYLQSDEMQLAGALDTRFDWLMDTFDKQQNKITFTFRDKKYTSVFLPGKRTETIIL